VDVEDNNVRGSELLQSMTRGPIPPMPPSSSSSILPRYPVSIGTTNFQSSSSSPLPVFYDASSSSASHLIVGKGPCLQEHQNLVRPGLQSSFLDLKGQQSKACSSTNTSSSSSSNGIGGSSSSSASQSSVFQSASFQLSSMTVGSSIMASSGSITSSSSSISVSSNSSNSSGIHMVAIGGIGSSGINNGINNGLSSSSSNSKDRVGILAAVDRKRALRRL
jgi:hypothetical protein